MVENDDMRFANLTYVAKLIERGTVVSVEADTDCGVLAQPSFVTQVSYDPELLQAAYQNTTQSHAFPQRLAQREAPFAVSDPRVGPRRHPFWRTQKGAGLLALLAVIVVAIIVGGAVVGSWPERLAVLHLERLAVQIQTRGQAHKAHREMTVVNFRHGMVNIYSIIVPARRIREQLPRFRGHADALAGNLEGERPESRGTASLHQKIDDHRINI